MTSDDELLVRRNHPRRRSAARNADARTPGGVGSLVQTNAEPRGIPAHAPADGRRVLPDSGGEDEGVETAERGGEGAELTADAIDEHIQRASHELLRVEEGSLYPALNPMLLKGWLRAEWGTSETNRKARFYRLTKEGRKQLTAEANGFNKLVDAIQLVMKTA